MGSNATPTAAFAALAAAVGKPATWQVDEASAQVGDGILDMYNKFKNSVTQAGDDEVPPELRTFMAVMESQGKLTLRKGAGRKIMEDINKDVEASKDYKQCKTHDAMARFREQWAKQKYDELIVTKYKDESTFDLASVDAEYCAFPRLVQREGGGTADPVSYDNAVNFTQSAVESWQKGETFHGHLWVKYCVRRKCAVILHYREKVSTGTMKKYGIRTEGVRRRSAANGDDAASAKRGRTSAGDGVVTKGDKSKDASTHGADSQSASGGPKGSKGF